MNAQIDTANIIAYQSVISPYVRQGWLLYNIEGQPAYTKELPYVLKDSTAYRLAEVEVTDHQMAILQGTKQ